MDPVTLFFGGSLFLVLCGLIYMETTADLKHGRKNQQLETRKVPLLEAESTPDKFNQKLRALSEGAVSVHFAAIKDKLRKHFEERMLTRLQELAEEKANDCIIPVMRNIMLIQGRKFEGEPDPESKIDRELVTLVADEFELLFIEHKVAYTRKNAWFSGNVRFYISW